MIHVILPAHLCSLAHTSKEVTVEVAGLVTPRTILDAVEASYPMLRGTIRDPITKQRRAYLRFFVAMEDISHEDPDAPLPDGVAAGDIPFRVIGAIAGG